MSIHIKNGKQVIDDLILNRGYVTGLVANVKYKIKKGGELDFNIKQGLGLAANLTYKIKKKEGN